MPEEMRRGRSQVIWRYSPGATFRYNESGAWCVTREVTLKNASSLQGALLKALTQALKRWDAIGPTGYPDPTFQTSKYEVGEPYQVQYDIWPTVFVCRGCGRVHFYKELSRLRQVNDRLSCMTCRGRDQLRQVPYAYVCECGRLDSISMQRHEPNHTIVLEDKGGFQESFWYCKDCRIPLYRNPREGLGFRRCECAPKKAKRGILLEDTRVYYSQTLDLVDIEPKSLERWKDHSRFSDLLLAAVLGVFAYKPNHLLDLANWKPGDTTISSDLKAMRDLLIKNGMTEEQADQMIRQASQNAGADPWVAYDNDLAPLRQLVGPHSWKDSRQTVEYVFVRDDPSTAAISLDQLIGDYRNANDEESAERLEEERELAFELGLINLRVIQALPILLAGYGYSRYEAGPYDVGEGSTSETPMVKLRPYGSLDGKIPIYVARNTTEALLFELDPWRLASYLSLNCGISVPKGFSVSSLRGWLLGQSSQLVTVGESHFLLRTFERNNGASVDATSAFLFGVLHSISHVLKVTAHRYVGIDADSLAEYLFPAHSVGLLYASQHVEFTLGGIDAVFRSNLRQWLGSVRDYAGVCSFDPVCQESGGACLACLYPKFGCAYFNRTVSRAFLLGGRISGWEAPISGFWSSDVSAEMIRLQRENDVDAKTT